MSPHIIGHDPPRAPRSPHPEPPAPSLSSPVLLPPTGLAAGCAPGLLLLLLTTVLSSTRAGPVPAPLRTLPGAAGCHMAQFKSLPPRELRAFRKAKDALVSVPTAPAAVGYPPPPPSVSYRATLPEGGGCSPLHWAPAPLPAGGSLLLFCGGLTRELPPWRCLNHPSGS